MGVVVEKQQVEGTAEVLVAALEFFLKEGSRSAAMATATLLPEPQRTKKLTWLLGVHAAEGQIEHVSKVAERLGRKPTPAELEICLKTCVERGLFNQAKEAGRLLGRELTQEEFGWILEACVAQGRLDPAQGTVKHLGRKLTADELDRIFEYHIKTWHFEEAQRVAESFPEPQRAEKLMRTLAACVEKGDANIAARVVGSLLARVARSW